MMLLLAGLALASSPWADLDADIRAEQVVPAPPEEVYAHLIDLRTLERIFPERCLSEVRVTEPPKGLGATVELTYHAAAMNRRLLGTLVEAIEPTGPGAGRIDIDHASARGFVTRFLLHPEGEEATRVEMTSYLNPPPWPFRRMFYTRVRPAWTQCYHDALEGLAEVVGGDG